MVDSGDEATVAVIGEVLSGPDDLADRKALDEVLQPGRNLCLVELISDKPILCNRQLANLVQMTIHPDESITHLKSHKDAVAAVIADLQARGLTWSDVVGLMALVARDSGDTAIADVLGGAARRCAGIEEER